MARPPGSAVAGHPVRMTACLAPLELADGTAVTIRSIRPEDAAMEQAFVRGLSPESRYLRFMQALVELTPEMLVRLTRIDESREAALVACIERGGREIAVGVARYVGHADAKTCEFAIVTADAWQRRGIGTRLMGELMRTARARGFRTMVGEVLASNTRMLDFVRGLGFVARASGDPAVRVVRREL
jgi:acetyltransferase